VREALIDEPRAGRSTLVIAPERPGALASGGGLNTRSAALSGRHSCSPPLSGRAAAVGHLHPAARISRRRRNLARRCFARNAWRPSEPMRASSMFAIRRLSMGVGAPARPVAGPTINSSQIREHARDRRPTLGSKAYGSRNSLRLSQAR
jgi:hypothetical protein